MQKVTAKTIELNYTFKILAFIFLAVFIFTLISEFKVPVDIDGLEDGYNKPFYFNI